MFDIIFPVAIGIAGVFRMVTFKPTTKVRHIYAILFGSIALVLALIAMLNFVHFRYAAWTGPVVWWSMTGAFALRARGAIGRWNREAHEHAMVLDAPFFGEWEVAVGGADRRRNHHLVASDQRFAYDFVREDSDAFGSAILAPVSGTVVVARDGMVDQPEQRNVHESRPAFGNCVAIETPGGTVFLCHLQRDSVAVAVGDIVTRGKPIGKCGNSGRTSISHLHIHAQREPHEASFTGTGIPIAFRSKGVAKILSADDILSGSADPVLSETLSAVVR